jgi:pre-mRNA-processing factor 19
LKGHTKKINHVALAKCRVKIHSFLPPVRTNSPKVWVHDTFWRIHSKIHSSYALQVLAVHPTNSIFALSSVDKMYSLHDLTTFNQIFWLAPSDAGFTLLAIHPDGTLLALGTPASTIQIYDVR